jgi:hypothetical protein
MLRKTTQEPEGMLLVPDQQDEVQRLPSVLEMQESEAML